jgi:hypothetical protein
VAVTVIVTRWPAPSEPLAGAVTRPATSAAGTTILNEATGPPPAVSVNVPVQGPRRSRRGSGGCWQESRPWQMPATFGG